jgi:hypothetical protein
MGLKRLPALTTSSGQIAYVYRDAESQRQLNHGHGCLDDLHQDAAPTIQYNEIFLLASLFVSYGPARQDHMTNRNADALTAA